MSFFKRLIPLKGHAALSLDKPTFVEGEPVTGRVDVTCEEYVQSEGVRVEARAYEHYEEVEWVTENNERVPRRVQKTNTLFSRDVPINGPSDFGVGPVRSFPFSVGIPSFRPTHGGGNIEYSVKGVVAVKGRPDITGTTQVAFTPPTYALVGAPMQQGYPPAPPAGYAPVQQVGQPTPGYPQYLVPPQPTQPKVQCSYCKTMMDQTATFCPNCGAHR